VHWGGGSENKKVKETRSHERRTGSMDRMTCRQSPGRKPPVSRR
jgi:hypothetical protein